MSSAKTRVKSNSILAPLESVNIISKLYRPAVVGYFKLTVTTGVAVELDEISAAVESVPASSKALTAELDTVVLYGIEPSFALALEHAANVNVYGTVAQPGCTVIFFMPWNESAIV